MKRLKLRVQTWYYRLRYWKKTASLVMADRMYGFDVSRMSAPEVGKLREMLFNVQRQKEEDYLKSLGAR